MPSFPGSPIAPGVARIKNTTNAPYAVEEMPGVSIPAGGEIDLCDTSLPSFYQDFEAAKALLTTLATAKLRQDVVAGTIEVVELRQPFGP